MPRRVTCPYPALFLTRPARRVSYRDSQIKELLDLGFVFNPLSELSNVGVPVAPPPPDTRNLVWRL